MKKLNFKKLSKKKKITLIIGLFLVLLTSGAISFHLLNQKNTSPKKETTKANKVKKSNKTKPVEKNYSLLSGVELPSADLKTSPVIGVMIENSPNARPQSGLADAEVVFEAIAEGGVTRFLALYQHNKPTLIGPVRSLRSYYIDWAWGFRASVAHVGGSGDALARIRDGAHRDMDEFFNTSTFWRTRDRWAPHNVYTNFTNLQNLNNSKGWTTSVFDGFNFKNDKKSPQETARQIHINLSGVTYNPTYNFDGNCNCYKRSQSGQGHLDREKGQIWVKNVVALKIPMLKGGDGYHNVYSTIGSGAGVVFKDGVFEEITWEKSSEIAPLILKDLKGNKIQLNRGSTWISAVPLNHGSINWQ